MSGLTGIWHVCSAGEVANANMLGVIKWHGPWRKYCFYPEANCLFDKSCLEEVAAFLDGLMIERIKITPDSGCVWCDIGVARNELGNHIINRRSSGRGDEAFPCPLLPEVPSDGPGDGA